MSLSYTRCTPPPVRARLPAAHSLCGGLAATFMDAISNTDKIEEPSLPLSARLADFWEMTKPGITVMVVLTAGFGFLLAAGRRFVFVLFVPTLLGTRLLSPRAPAPHQGLVGGEDAPLTRTP